jgi:proteasome assembly chaperone (PAC2) family protein
MEESRPLLVAVWPGMGQVALTAGYYLMSRLHMHETDPLPSRDLFDTDHVDVEGGLVRGERAPRSRLFRWEDPARRRDVTVLLGEAQPPAAKRAYCARLLDHAERAGIADVFTFAAMATEMQLGAPSRVYGATTDEAGRDLLRRFAVPPMPDGRIAGLNGVLLGAAAKRGLRGYGLLGEMPGFVSQVPFAKSSAAVLEVFSRMTGIPIDLAELQEYGRTIENRLVELVAKVQEAVERTDFEAPSPEALSAPEEPAEEAVPSDGVTEMDRKRIENLFAHAHRERSKAFELKRELDRLGLFERYEDRFLDLFRRPA